ncbi:hypothetical protein CCR83_15145 [Rhodobacter veldkampii DSM 11550]|uniref:OmpW family protein n=1 Tax=Phaeovulum veldkampii DSM 11550 TaxID=1185920 RepID=A0A2T4JIM5_9RHOB|nr:OmpW family outer membrane protein [Phaeovulum veldkampii]MBK5947747.1 hypothetical protein [Phaeovulum veldkampii DSM 11550]PTE17713.1 hypothetical protein C5F46_07640 [Phaeovulum veldkampii DSM 11550]TDQ58219.1 outer membrane protein [Phaeovulum veldkampii DSM 11550]
MKTLTALTLPALLCCLAAPVAAQSAGDYTIGLGLGVVAPTSGNGVLAGSEADVDNNVQPTLTFEYFIRDNLGIEVLAATPFKHSVSTADLGEVATTKHLPPTISLNYHFDTGSAWKPFVGLGVNYTAFFEEKGVGALAGTSVKIDDSWGLAATLGLDYALSDRTALRSEVRWMDIDADVTVDGASVGTAEIDPIVAGVSYIIKF